jgi:hypothetical protein
VINFSSKTGMELKTHFQGMKYGKENSENYYRNKQDRIKMHRSSINSPNEDIVSAFLFQTEM